MARRTWPRPPDGAIHLIGDTHFGSLSMTENRKALWAADQVNRSGMLPDTLLHVVVGDLTDHSLTAEDNEAVAWCNTYLGVSQWISAVGNHDMFGRLAPAAASAWGMPGGGNYVHDLPGLCRLVVVAPDDGIENDGFTMKPFTTSRLSWLADQCAAASDVPCLIVCHWSLADTVGPTPASTISSFSPGFHADIDADIRAMLADTPNAAAWLSGHTHSPLNSPGLVSSVEIAGRPFMAINASAPCYTGDIGDNLGSQQATLYLTITDGSIEVRFRDHGAGVWTVAGPQRTPVWSASIAQEVIA